MLKVLLVCLLSSFAQLKSYQDVKPVSFEISQKDETKQRKEMIDEYGYILLSVTDLCDNQFILNCIDVYSPMSIMMSPPYTNFSFSVLGDIFTDARVVKWDNVDSTDLGYSTGSPVTSVTYTFRTSGISSLGFNYHWEWDVVVSNNANLLLNAHFTLQSYRTSSVNLEFYQSTDISSTDGSYVLVIPDSSSNNMSKVLFNDNNENYQRGYTNGYNDGNSNGYQTGYSAGIEYAQEQSSTALTIFTGIINVGMLPINVFLKMFNYEVFGINIAGLISSILTIGVVIIIVRVVTGQKND